MPNISVQLLMPGMTTVTDVINRRGQVLVPSGTAVTERHLRGLKMWGIEAVDIRVEDLDGVVQDSALSESQMPEPDAVMHFVDSLFVHNQSQSEHPFLSELRKLCLSRFTQSGIPHTHFVARPSEGVKNEESKTDPPSQTRSLSVEQMIKKNAGLATPPDIYAKLTQAMERNTGSSASIASVIGNDPGLAARLLRIVNSAYYSFPSPIETISRAVTIVGTDELRNMVLATSVIKTFSAGLDGVLDMEQFWRHSIACALFSKHLAMLRNDQNSGRFFTTGLLHDIGRLIMVLEMPASMAKLLGDPTFGEDVCRKERGAVGSSHTQVGAALADAWRLSSRQKEAVEFHHAPERATRFPIDAAILHVSDIMAIAFQFGSGGSLIIPRFQPEAWDQVQIAPAALGRIVSEVDQEASDLIKIFYEKGS